MYEYARVQAGRVVAVGSLSVLPDDPAVIVRVGGVPSLGDTWDGAQWVEPAPLPAPVGRVYTKLGWMDAIGDAASMQIMLSDDPVIRLIDRKFQAATEIDTEHSATQQAFAYLVASAEVPAFTAATVDALRGVDSGDSE